MCEVVKVVEVMVLMIAVACDTFDDGDSEDQRYMLMIVVTMAIKAEAVLMRTDNIVDGDVDAVKVMTKVTMAMMMPIESDCDDMKE